jgi:hypothetical protein
LDDDFSDLLIIPSKYYTDIKNSSLVGEGLLIFQDKASVYSVEQLRNYIKKGDTIIEARAGCGTKLAQLSELVGKEGRIFAFENRPGRLETLKSRIKIFGCNNVIVIEEDFGTCNVQHEQFNNVSIVIVEPLNSGTTIIDKLGFMLQEEEYPVNDITIKDLLGLKRQQIATLKHAFKFPNVQHILYQTRSAHPEENEHVVGETLERWAVEWRLNEVLPGIAAGNDISYIEECLSIKPSTTKGNGIFIAHFQIKPLEVKELEPEDNCIFRCDSILSSINDLQNQNETVPKSKGKKKERKRGEPLKIKLPKQLRSSVNRLSVPRITSLELKGDAKVINGILKNETESAARTTNKLETIVPEKLESQEEIDISVFGLSLKKFFGPRASALKQIHAQKSVPEQSRWIYPVFAIHLGT